MLTEIVAWWQAYTQSVHPLSQTNQNLTKLQPFGGCVMKWACPADRLVGMSLVSI